MEHVPLPEAVSRPWIKPDRTRPRPLGSTVNGAVATTVTVPPGGTVEVPFLLTWHYPNKYNAGHTWMGCHYATRWPDARAVLRQAAPGFAQMRSRTELFRRTFYDSTLPYWLLDCVTANAAIIRHIGVVFRIANGDVYGWEGSNGCCQPTCTHVWGYEQTLARLFPDLERDMRRIDFKHQQREDGGVNNRTDVPSPPRPTGEQPFADGHASCILKAYREALNQPDDAFFREYWPHIKRAVDYLIGRDAKIARRPAERRICEDDQWNTYDEALHGVTTFISGYYLAALRAGEEWARRQGDDAAARPLPRASSKRASRSSSSCAGMASTSSSTCPATRSARRSRPRLHGRPAHRPVVGAPARPRLHPAAGQGRGRAAGGLQIQLQVRPDRLETHAARLCRGRRTRA